MESILFLENFKKFRGFCHAECLECIFVKYRPLFDVPPVEGEQNPAEIGQNPAEMTDYPATLHIL